MANQSAPHTLHVSTPPPPPHSKSKRSKMGLIRSPKKQPQKSRVWNISRLFDNQNLLDNYLNVLLRLPSSSNLPPDLEHLSAYRKIEETQFLDLRVDELVEIYAEQYDKIEQAIAAGSVRRLQQRLDQSSIETTTTVATLSQDDEEMFQSTLAMANRRLPVDEMAAQLKQIIGGGGGKCGDILDTKGYRGTGYYLMVTLDHLYGRATCVKTVGQYGCHLPMSAWQFVQLHGTEFFDMADVWACYLPPHTKIIVNSADGKRDIVSSSRILVAWLYSGETLEIDGCTYKAMLWDIC